MVYNAGAAPWGAFMDLDAEGIMQAYRTSSVGPLVAAQQVWISLSVYANEESV